MSCASIADPQVAARVVVSVSGDGTISCSPDPITVRSGEREIEFTLDTPGYVFRPKNAIVVSKPGRDFPSPSVTSKSGRMATLRDRALDRMEYKYTVYLKEVATGRAISLDPVIQNDPE